MPIFTPQRPKKRKKLLLIDKEATKIKIDKMVDTFDIQMESGNFHGAGGCQIAIPNEGQDCGSCPSP